MHKGNSTDMSVLKVVLTCCDHTHPTAALSFHSYKQQSRATESRSSASQDKLDEGSLSQSSVVIIEPKWMLNIIETLT